jgi:23S rRNA pseudouridine2605 synthase
MSTVDGKPAEGERIARRIARAGVASRRVAEAMIAEGRVTVNGLVIDSPALNVTARDKITVDGQPLAAPEPPRLWRYYKPIGLVTSERDEKGRDTVFSRLPEDMPRVVSVGRLDLNSEGLLLLTNDGALKRRLELPTTGWLRKYRVRARGEADDAMLEPLRRGIVVDGERFQPMTVTLDRTQGSNVWLTMSLREGRNREVRRALDVVGLEVNRLIRVSYGPFQLGELEPGEVDEVRPKVLREQLGIASESGRAKDARPGGTATSRAGSGKGGAGARVAKSGATGTSAAHPGGTGTGPAKAGAAKAGAPRAGAVKAGAAKAGAPRAGAVKAGIKRAGAASGAAPGATGQHGTRGGQSYKSQGAAGKPAGSTTRPKPSPKPQRPGKPLTPKPRQPK